MLKILMILSVMALQSCGFVTYHAQFADGSKTDVWGYRIGTDEVIKNFNADISPVGRKISIGSIDSNQTKGLEQLNNLVKSIVEGAVKGAK